MLSRDEYLAAWSRWHGGTGTESALVRGWLSLAWTPGASPRRSAPDRRDGARARWSPAAAVLPAAGRRARGWCWPGCWSGSPACSTRLDGALAIGTGRASRRGFVLDSVVDRLTEVAYAGALWVAGAPGWLAVAFGALCWLPDYLRARAGQAGVRETGAISVWERPTRVADDRPHARRRRRGRRPRPAEVVDRGSGRGCRCWAASASSQLGLWLRRALAGPGSGDPIPPA